MEDNEEKLKLFIGRSSMGNEFNAVQEAITMALKEVSNQGSPQPHFTLILSTDQYNPHLIAEAMNDSSNGTAWAGCTSAGVFSQAGFMEQGLVVGMISDPDIHVGIGISKLSRSQSRLAGAQATATALKSFKTNHSHSIPTLIVFADSKNGDVAEVIRGAVQEAGVMNIWAGGGVGNMNSHTHPAEFAYGQTHTDHVLVIAIDSPRPCVTGIAHGWQPYGPPTMVTRTQDLVTQELEYEKPFEIYRKTAADRGETVTPETFARFSVTHPLGIPQANGEYVIRDPIGLESDGSLRFIGEVPDGCLVRIMKGDPSALLKAAHKAAENAKTLASNQPGGALIFDCISRYHVLKKNYFLEINEFKTGLGSTPFMGCLTVGEVGTVGQGIPQFHNKTAVVMALQG